MRRRVLLAALLPVLGACQMPQGEATQAPVPVVFFTEDSAALSDSGRATVAEAARLAKANPDAPVTVMGFAGPAGSQGYNQALSDARARMVADTLIAEGVPASRIQIRPRGPVPYEMIPTESRRVEIHVGS